MESIEKLREIVKSFHSLKSRWDTLAAIDEVEREIERDYTKLPVDADGVPIHVGDVLDPPKGSEEYGRLMVTELTYDGEDWYFKGEIPASFTGQAGYFNVIGFAHIKPRTVEDVLRDCCDEWNEHCGDDWEQGVYAKYAAELRELMEVDA